MSTDARSRRDIASWAAGRGQCEARRTMRAACLTPSSCEIVVPHRLRGGAGCGAEVPFVRNPERRRPESGRCPWLEPAWRQTFLKAKGEGHEGRKDMKKVPRRKTGTETAEHWHRRTEHRQVNGKCIDWHPGAEFLAPRSQGKPLPLPFHPVHPRHPMRSRGCSSSCPSVLPFPSSRGFWKARSRAGSTQGHRRLLRPDNRYAAAASIHFGTTGSPANAEPRRPWVSAQRWIQVIPASPT